MHQLNIIDYYDILNDRIMHTKAKLVLLTFVYKVLVQLLIRVYYNLGSRFGFFGHT